MRKFLLALGVVLLVAAWQINTVSAQQRENQVRDQSIKYQRLMALIDAFYVDTVDLHKLTEDAIVKVLADLDPHSVYISKEEVAEMIRSLNNYLLHIKF